MTLLHATPERTTPGTVLPPAGDAGTGPGLPVRPQHPAPDVVGYPLGGRRTHPNRSAAGDSGPVSDPGRPDEVRPGDPPNE